jgi:site-specific recombinase XerD
MEKTDELKAAIEESEAEELEEKTYKSPQEEFEAELKPELREIKAKENKLPAVLSRKEFRELIPAFKRGKLAFRNNLIVRLFYATGMRVEELEGLRFCGLSYDTHRRTIFVRSGKGGKDRYCCADERTFNQLREWQRGKKLEDPVCGVKKRQIKRVVEKAGELTGISQKYDAMDRVFSCHSFRHAFATHSCENGMSIFTLKKLLGHEYLNTTAIYIHLSMEAAGKEYSETNPLREG